MNCPWLYDGVTMLTRGQAFSETRVLSLRGLSSVHGQLVLPDGGDGSSLKVGQRNGYSGRPIL